MNIRPNLTLDADEAIATIRAVDIIKKYKKIINILILLIIIFCCLSCVRNQPNSPLELFNNYQIVTLHQVEIPEMLIGSPTKIFYLDTLLFYSETRIPFFKIIDLKRFQLKQFGSKGQGPNEFIMPFVQSLNDGNILVLDIQLAKLFEIDLHKTYLSDSLCVNKVAQLDRKDGVGIFCVIKMNDRYVATGVFEKGMFAIFDSNGNLIKTRYKYPKHPEHDNIENRIKGMAYQGSLIANQKQNKFVFATYDAAIIEFFDLKSDSLVKTAAYYNTYPKYVPKRQGDGISAAIRSDNEKGYRCLYGTEKYVYALYSGRTWNEYLEAENECLDLLVFDWDGHPVKHYILNQAIFTFYISSDDRFGYGIGLAPEPTLFKFDLIDGNE